MHRFLFVLFVACWGNFVFAQNRGDIQKSIQHFVKDDDFKNTSIGIHIVRLKDRQVLGAYQAEKSLVTASTLKLLTAATALLQRGPDFYYKTPIGYTGKLQKGILYGDLIITGVGDPTFNSKYFPQNNVLQKILHLLQQKKIHKIKGNILLDISAFKSEIPRTWIWEDIGSYYGSTLFPLNYHDNTYKINFRTGKAGTKIRILSVVPQQSLTFENNVLASRVNADRAYVFGSPLSNKRIVCGTLPQFRKSFVVKGAMPHPEITFGKDLKWFLKKNGISVSGRVVAKSIQQQQHLGYLQSPSLQEIITKTNQYSVNLFAEAIERVC